MLQRLKNLVFLQWKYVLGALLIIVFGGYAFFGRGGSLGATLVITPTDFREQVSVSGTVIAAKDVDLGFAANGRILGVYARVGQYVAAGTILAETENGDLVANLASLQAGTRPEEISIAQTDVTSAEAALVNALQSVYTTSDDAVHNRADVLFSNARTSPKLSFTVSNVTLQNTVESDRATIESTLASLALLVEKLSNENAVDSAAQAQTFLTHMAAFLADASDAINQGLPDRTTSATTLASYATSLATARTNINSAITTLTASHAALDAAQKTLLLKQAGAINEDIAAAQAALAKTRVVAPFSGVVTRMDAKVGEIVSPTTSEISMQSAGVFQIETFVPEVAIARVAIGNPATTTLDAYGSSIEFPATVVSVDPAETVKDGVPTYKTVLSFLRADPRIRSGMTTNVILETGTLHDAIVIPAGAVGQKNGVSYVSVLARGSVSARTVTTGSTPALGQTYILSGLSKGDMILLTPAP